MSVRDRAYWASFFAGLLIALGAMLQYSLQVHQPHEGCGFNLYHLLYQAMPWTMALLLMAPAGAPMVMATVRDIWGKMRVSP